jgi:hypothetical protein
VVRVRDTGLKVRRLKSDRGHWIFKDDKNSQHAFLRKGAKAVGPLSQDFIYIHSTSMKYVFRRRHSSLISPCSPTLLLDGSAGRIARKPWWTNQEFPVDIIPPWFSMLIHHLRHKH